MRKQVTVVLMCKKKRTVNCYKWRLTFGMGGVGKKLAKCLHTYAVLSMRAAILGGVGYGKTPEAADQIVAAA
ncbi:glycosyl transferase [Corchorus olitorius]|uniref:Glycosyl transferase n=1 Tax=Corchorus olitorius TaxID=93759 RepID=A0A1R3J2B2_9ROSI|nr:glycosyl transferase [Corchorus olitorius]